MRNISVQLTQNQIRAGTKSVTRRLGWESARVGERLMACPKCQGLGPGGKMERIHPLEIVSNHPEPLTRMLEDPVYGRAEAILEGFPELDGEGFVEMFCHHMGVQPQQIVNRLAFEHVFPHDWIAATLKSKTNHFHSELKLHDQIARAFLAAGIPFEREVRMEGGIVDFLVLGHVSVEVKTAGSGVAATRQSFRYLEDPRATQGVIISAAPMEVPVSGYLAQDGRTKSLHLVELWRNAL
jgi:hypothetical protein